MLVLTKAGIRPDIDDAELTALRAQFDQNHIVRLPGFIAADLLDMLRKRLDSARFSRRIEHGVEIELTLEDPAALALALVTLNDPALFAAIGRITTCGPVGCFSGRVYSRRAVADGAHYYPWHNDIGHERLVGLSVNLSDKSFAGGVLEMREEHSKRLVARVANRTAGDAVLFRISPDLEHHVTPVTAGGERLVLAGWFRRSPDFWRHACASS